MQPENDAYPSWGSSPKFQVPIIQVKQRLNLATVGLQFQLKDSFSDRSPQLMLVEQFKYISSQSSLNIVFQYQ